MPPADQPGNAAAEQKRQEDRDAAQTRQRPVVQMPFQAGTRYPATHHRQIAYVPGQDKRGQHRGRKNSQVEKRQLIAPRTVSWMQISDL